MKKQLKKMLHIAKIFLLLFGFIVSKKKRFAQKIALVGIDHSSSSANGGDYDGISFTATENLVAGTIFYRLKMKDVDGRFTYSNIIKLFEKVPR